MASVLDGIKPCLDYLDKEMTIQGVLSGFCMAAAAAVFSTVRAAENSNSQFVHLLQCNGLPYLLVGCAILIIAGAAFYKERSDLAWLYSAMALAAADQELGFKSPGTSWPMLDCLNTLDSWYLWLWYKVGCVGLCTAALEFVFAVASTNAHFYLFNIYRNVLAWPPLALPLLWYVLSHFRLSRKDKDQEGEGRKKKKPPSRSKLKVPKRKPN